MTEIRVTYSGLIAFAIRLISIVTGTIFTIIVTRQLTAEEFGTWGLIGGILIYPLIINPIVGYWATREIARGERSASTALLSSGILSIGGIGIYFAVTSTLGTVSNADMDMILFATLLVPLIFVYNTLAAITLGFRPQAVSYGLLTFEIIKIPLALLFIYHFKLGLEGAITVTLFSYVISIMILIYLSRAQLQTQFERRYLRKWLRMSWLPTYKGLPAIISMSDVAVFSIITGSVVGVAYYVAAKTVGMLVDNVRSFSIGLYPKLLESKKQEFLQENLVKMFYFSFPLMALSIVFSKPGLFVLNPIYQEVFLAVIFFTIRSFLVNLNAVFFQSLEGMEDIDQNEKPTFKEYIKSKLIHVPTFEIVRYGIYIITLGVMLYVLSSESELDLILYWVIIGLAVEIPFTIYMIRTVRRTFTLKIAWYSVSKYLLSSIIIFGIIFAIMEQHLEYKESIFEFLPMLLVYAIGGILAYLGITYVIDSKTKELGNMILDELIKGRRSK